MKRDRIPFTEREKRHRALIIGTATNEELLDVLRKRGLAVDDDVELAKRFMRRMISEEPSVRIWKDALSLLESRPPPESKP